MPNFNRSRAKHQRRARLDELNKQTKKKKKGGQEFEELHTKAKKSAHDLDLAQEDDANLAIKVLHLEEKLAEEKKNSSRTKEQHEKLAKEVNILWKEAAQTQENVTQSKLHLSENLIEKKNEEINNLTETLHETENKIKKLKPTLHKTIVQCKINRLAMKLKCKKFNIPFPTSIGIPN